MCHRCKCSQHLNLFQALATPNNFNSAIPCTLCQKANGGGEVVGCWKKAAVQGPYAFPSGPSIDAWRPPPRRGLCTENGWESRHRQEPMAALYTLSLLLYTRSVTRPWFILESSSSSESAYKWEWASARSYWPSCRSRLLCVFYCCCLVLSSIHPDRPTDPLPFLLCERTQGKSRLRFRFLSPLITAWLIARKSVSPKVNLKPKVPGRRLSARCVEASLSLSEI